MRLGYLGLILAICAFPSFGFAQEVAKAKESGINAEIKKQIDAIPLIADTKTPEEAGLKRISKTERIWLDPKNRMIVIDGSIAINDGPLEMFACPRRTKEHESVVSVDCKSSTAPRWSPDRACHRTIADWPAADDPSAARSTR